MSVELAQLREALAGRYTVEREIGSGGMAIVYLATDVRHERQVALKVLRPELGAVLGGERFLREIHIAAGLNHPHILALYDSGEADGLLYYVMPYVEGESLRQKLDRETQLPIEEALEIARQVAGALDYAHRQGVVHRDIKPENILLQEGEAEVADFGIARALRVAGGDRLTETGLSLGTPAYMSPEQASGVQELDARSDLYSLACVVYEMLAGDPPFTGPTVPAIIARQLVDPVPSLRVVRPSVPEGLERAIEKALAKVPADRYGTAGAFAEAVAAGAQAAVIATGAPHAAVASATPSGGVPEVSPRRKKPAWRTAVPLVLAGAIAIGVAALLIPRWLGGGPLQITTSNIRQITRDPGLEFQPALSPDGEEVAYVVGPIGNPRIVVRSTIDVGGGGRVGPGEAEGGQQWIPSWSTDGASVRFLSYTEDEGWSWKQVGKLGGAVRTIGLPRVTTRLTWSTDEKRVAFVVEDSIFIYAADGGEPEQLGAWYAFRSHSPTWSPDGRRIAYVSGNMQWRYGANVADASIWVLDLDGRDPIPVTTDEHLNVSPQWLPDSRHLLFVSDRDGPRGIYVVEVGREGARGPPRSVAGASDPHSISISADGRRLAYSKFAVAQNIWSIPIPAAGVASIRDATLVTHGNQVIEGTGLSPDGEWIVFDSDFRGNSDIYKVPLAGGEPQLVADMPDHAFSPDWSPDGTEIAFHAHDGNPSAVWTVPAGGGTPEPLTDRTRLVGYPAWSPDGLTIAFQSQGRPEEGAWGVWLVSRDSIGGSWGQPARLTDFWCARPAWTPDGESVVCYAGDDEFARVSRDGTVLARLQAGVRGAWRTRFSRDGSRIYFTGTAEDGSRGIWWIPAYGGTVSKIVAFDDPSLVVPGMFTVGSEHFYITIAKYESDIYVGDLDW